VAIIKLAHSSKKGSVLWLSFFPMGRQAFKQCETRIIIKKIRTGTRTILVYFLELQLEVLHKSKEPPNTAFNRILF
jgi:hypothetical protein